MRDTPQLRLADAALGAARRRRRRAVAKARRRQLAGVTGKTDEQVLEELIGPNWREIVLGEGAGVDAPMGDEGDAEGAATANNGTDEYWDEVRRVNRADDLAARRPIAVPGDGSGSFAHAEKGKTPIVTPESWGKADDGTGFGLR